MIISQKIALLKKAFVAACALLITICITPTEALSEGKPLSNGATINNMIPALTDPGSARIAEIYAMDKSTLTRSQKRELRNEVKLIRENSGNGGVYLSVGAIIIIVLLLILLL